MENGKFKVNVAEKKVTLGHKTKTTDGHVELTTTFDLSKFDMEKLLKRAADAELISWRARSGVKNLTEAEALAKFKDAVVDCSAKIERIKHVKTEQEKRMEVLLKVITSGKDIPGVLTVAQARAEILAMPAMVAKSDEGEAQEDMDAGETTE